MKKKLVRVPVLLITQGKHSLETQTPMQKIMSYARNSIREDAVQNTAFRSPREQTLHDFSFEHHEGNGYTGPRDFDEMQKHFGRNLNMTGRSTEQEADAIRKYTTESKRLNTDMVAQHKGEKQIPEGSETDTTIKNMKSVAGKLRLKAPQTVFSGVKWHPPTEIAKAGGLVDLPAFTSTSLDANVADQFAGDFVKGEHEHGGPNAIVASHMVRFHLPEGHPVLPAWGISSYKNEREVVLPPGRFKLSDKPTVIQHRDGRNETHIWDAHPVGEVGGGR